MGKITEREKIMGGTRVESRIQVKQAEVKRTVPRNKEEAFAAIWQAEQKVNENCKKDPDTINLGGSGELILGLKAKKNEPPACEEAVGLYNRAQEDLYNLKK